MTEIDNLSEQLREICRHARGNDAAFLESELIHALAEIIRANHAKMTTVPINTYIGWVSHHLSECVAALQSDGA